MTIVKAIARALLLRDIARSLRSLADSQRRLADAADRSWGESHPAFRNAIVGTRPAKPRHAEFSVLDESAVATNLREHLRGEGYSEESIAELLG